MTQLFGRAVCTCVRTKFTNVIGVRLIQTAVVEKPLEKPSTSRTFPEQQIHIKTCGKLYEKWKEQKRFRSIPNGDLSFNVRYIDTLKGENDFSAVNNDSPVVLALHGAPGSYKDFNLLTSYLSEQGVRVISPCFPGYTEYKPGVFRHSASEKAEFVKDFLEAINVPYVDLMICHSSAVYPGLQLCNENQKPKISGLALFNPGTYHTTMRAVRPLLMLNTIVKMSESKLGMKFLQKYGLSFMKLSRIQVRIDSCYDPLLSMTVMVYAGILESRKLFHQLQVRKFPVLMAFSEDDKLMDKELSYKVAYKLGVQDHHIYHFNQDCILDREGKVVNNVKVLAFEKGSHYVFSKHSDIINEEVYDFLQNHIL